ncbi:MAG TPA: peptide deformylase [Pseudogracilibacillus sp.]|nr:peptide deformylase [Pseudogracilibacillus sp.]
MLTMEDVVRDGHPALREKAADVPIPLEDEDKELLNKMRQFIINSQDEELAEKYKLRAGVGIAAPQLGVTKKMTAIYFEYDGKQYDYRLVNPKIISHSVEQAYLAGGEGCLSVDEVIEGYVVRYKRITVRAYNEAGEQVKLRLKGYPAIVFQHEIDHLNGVMFYDHINQDDPFSAPEGASAIE